MIRKIFVATFLTSLASTSFLSTSQADPLLPDWSISGEALTSYEHYQSYGDDNASPYQETGGEAFISEDLNFSRKISAYELIKGRFSSVLNSSSYRSPYENEYLIEQFALSWQKGDARIPFNVDVGDYYASFSSKTLQSPLKGLRVEIQPSSQTWQHSIVGLSGYNDNIYRNIKPENNAYQAVSWLAEHEQYGAWIANLVYNQQKQNSPVNQSVFSLATAQTLKLFNQSMDIEAEFGFLNGNPEGLTTENTDQSYSLNINSQIGSSIQYLASFEQNGQYYRPAGGSVSADQREFETSVSWRLVNGMQANLRGQWLETSFESVNPLQTNTYGARLVGTIFDRYINQLNMTFNAQTTDATNRNDSTDSRTHSSSLNLSKRLSDTLNLRGATRWRLNKNDNTDKTTMTHELSFGLDQNINWYNWTGSISPGFVISEIHADSRNSKNVRPSFNATLNKGPHNFSGHYQFEHTDQDPTNVTTQVDQQTASLRYSYNHGNYTLSSYSDLYDRAPNATGDTHAYRFGLQLAVQFNRPAIQTPPEDSVFYDSPEMLSEFERLWTMTGQPPHQIISALGELGYRNIQTRADQIFVSGLFITQIPLSQQLIYDFEDRKKLQRSAMIFTPTSIAEKSLKRRYQDTLDELIKRFGQPDRAYEKGTFTATLGVDLFNNEFKRIIEWHFKGELYRFGIPQRPDGRITFELQHGATMPNAQSNMWSITQ